MQVQNSSKWRNERVLPMWGGMDFKAAPKFCRRAKAAGYRIIRISDAAASGSEAVCG